jgi:hypothetical protein
MSSPWKFARFVLATASVAILVWPRLKQTMMESTAAEDEEVPLGAESAFVAATAANEPPGNLPEQD